uniref:Uncharacterized protein n=1 Tax=Amphimedon queenslandica TaxID=400682 RepID=A0A1X7VQ58_AMPQE
MIKMTSSHLLSELQTSKVVCVSRLYMLSSQLKHKNTQQVSFWIQNLLTSLFISATSTLKSPRPTVSWTKYPCPVFGPSSTMSSVLMYFHSSGPGELLMLVLIAGPDLSCILPPVIFRASADFPAVVLPSSRKCGIAFASGLVLISSASWKSSIVKARNILVRASVFESMRTSLKSPTLCCL